MYAPIGAAYSMLLLIKVSLESEHAVGYRHYPTQEVAFSQADVLKQIQVYSSAVCLQKCMFSRAQGCVAALYHIPTKNCILLNKQSGTQAVIWNPDFDYYEQIDSKILFTTHRSLLPCPIILY